MRSSWSIRFLLALIAAGLTQPASAHTLLERQVLAVLNFARAHPNAYAASLQQYRGMFHAKLVSLPGQKEDWETTEGVQVVNETITFLGGQAALPELADAELLSTSAADLVAAQSQSGNTGHRGDDGSSPALRVQRRGGGAYVAEVIAYGPIDAVDAIRQLIVDDGVPDRGHRSILYSPELKFAGVSCGRHPEYRTMCVIDLGITEDGRLDQRPLRFARAEQAGTGMVER